MSFLSNIFSKKNEEKTVATLNASDDIQEKFKEKILLSVNKNQEKLQLLLSSNIQRNSISMRSNHYPYSGLENDFFTYWKNDDYEPYQLHSQNLYHSMLQDELSGSVNYGLGVYDSNHHDHHHQSKDFGDSMF